MIVLRLEKMLQHGHVMTAVDIDNIVTRLARSLRRIDIPATKVCDVALAHGPRLHRINAVRRHRARRHRRDAAIVIGAVKGVVNQLDAGERAVLVHRIGHQPMLRDIALVPQPPLDKGRQFRTGMNLHFLGADNAPAALGLDRSIGGLGARASVPQHVAVRHLEKTIRRRHRADFHRLE